MASTSLERRHIIGLDLARALAVFGMVAVNFKTVMAIDGAGGATLSRLAIGLIEGKAAALFVTLAGIGIVLSSVSPDGAVVHGAYRRILVRAALLGLVGVAFLPVWPADILHFYAVYLVVAMAFLRAPSGLVVAAAIGFAVLFPVLLGFFSYEAEWDFSTLTYAGLWTWQGFMKNLFFNGFHPVFPWAAFVLGGVWLGRRNLGNGASRRRLLLGAGVALTATVLVSRAGIWAMAVVAPDQPDAQYLFATAPMPPFPLYIIAGFSTAVITICLCCMAGERFAGTVVVRLLSRVGQMAMTIYFAHVIVGLGVLGALGLLSMQSADTALIATLVFFAGATLFAALWRTRFRRGPVETLIRALTPVR